MTRPLTLTTDPDADCPHTVEFVRDGDVVFLHDQDERGRFTTLMWPAGKAREIAAALLRAVGE